MDNFIDKLAQKFIAGEVIKANSVAEERELKRLREQVADYERCLQEMRKLQITNTQSARHLHDLMTEGNESFRKLTQESLEKLEQLRWEAEQKEAEAEDILEQTRKTMEEITEVTKQLAVSVEENQREVEKWFHQADDYLHKENVKVYRNVQAVVVEEVGKKAEAVIRAQEEQGKKYSKPVLILLILTLLASLGNIVLTLLIKFGLF